MDHLRRLILLHAVVASCAIVLLVNSARAQSVPATPEYSAANAVLWRHDAFGLTCPGIGVPVPQGAVIHATAAAAAQDAQTKAQAQSDAWRNRWIASSCSGFGGVTSYGYVMTFLSASGGVEQWRIANLVASGTTFFGQVAVRSVSGQCPAGFSATGQSGAQACLRYTCPLGYSLNGTTCDRLPDCEYPRLRNSNNTCACPSNSVEREAAGLDWVTQPSASGFPPSTACVGGCTTAVQWQACHGVGAARQCGGVAVGPSGSSCTVPASNPAVEQPDTPETECTRSGRCPGTLNGQLICLPCSSMPTPSERRSEGGGTSTTTNPDGSTTTREVVEDRRVVCQAGACSTIINTTTTTTTRNAQGTVTGVTTTTDTVTRPGDHGSGVGRGGNGNGDGDGEGSGFGGSCAAGFVCEGDAIQCAIAREQHIRNCETLSPISGTTKAAAENRYRDASESKGLPADFVKNNVIQATNLNTGDRINAGSCPAPVAFNTPLGAFTLDTTSLCEPARWFGFVILFTSILIAVRITLQGLV